MAKSIARSGWKHIIATPHIMEGVYQNTPESIATAVQALNQRLEKEGCPATVWPGAEVYLHPELALWCREGRLPTLAGSGTHLLIELPHTSLPLYAETVLFELMLQGITPVIAHPERQQQLAQDLERVAAWVERGVWLQLNAPSLLGRYGRRAKSTAMELVKEGLVHCLGSDSHESRRPPALSEAEKIIGRLRGGEKLVNRFWDNARAILKTANATGEERALP